MMLIALMCSVLLVGSEVDVREFVQLHLAADQALVAGETEESKNLFLSCLEIEPQHATVAYGLACTAAKAGELDESIEWLNTAAKWGYGDANVARWDPDLDAVREHPGLANALEAFGAQASRRKQKGIATGMTEGVSNYAGSASIYMSGDYSKGFVTCVALARKSGLVVQGDSKGIISFLEKETGRLLFRSKKLDSAIWRLAVAPASDYVFALTWNGLLHRVPTSASGEIKSWPVLAPSADEMGTLGWPFGAFLEFDSSGNRLLIAATERGAVLRSGSGEAVEAWTDVFGYFAGVTTRWSSNGEFFAGVCEGELRKFSGETGAEILPPIGNKQSETIHSIAYGPKGRLGAKGLDQGRLQVWDLETGKPLFESTCPDPIFEADPVRVIRFSPDGKRIAFSTSSSVFVQVIDAKDGEILWNSGFLGGRMGERADLSWSPDSNRLWHGYEGGAMTLYQVSFEKKVSVRDLSSGCPPIGLQGPVAVFASENGTALADSRTGRIRWKRCMQSDASNLIYTPHGYFSIDEVLLDGFEIYFAKDWENKTDLVDHGIRLFDPKRVRACQAGVSLTPFE